MKLRQVCSSISLVVVMAIALSTSTSADSKIKIKNTDAEKFVTDSIVDNNNNSFSDNSFSESNRKQNSDRGIYQRNLGDSGLIRTRTNVNDFFESHQGDNTPKMIIEIGVKF